MKGVMGQFDNYLEWFKVFLSYFDVLWDNKPWVLGEF
jgi:hypothetical protein